MSKFTTFFKVLKRPKDFSSALFSNLKKAGLLRWIPDKMYLKLYYRSVFHKKLNLDNPKTFNEKIQWLKLYDRKPCYSVMVDKYEVKQYVSNILGKEHIIPTLGVWENPSQIDWSILPSQFVLKCTHDSGGLVICRDISCFNKTNAIKTLKRALKNDFYSATREWPYKSVQRRVIAEQYMSDDTPFNNGGLTDYKFYCFNGVAYKVMVCIDRDKHKTKFYSFDRDWNLLRHNIIGKKAPDNFTLPKPSCIDTMFEMAEKLAIGIPFVRIDFYYVKGRIYFSEITLYPDSGFDSHILPETDIMYGNMIDINSLLHKC